MSDCDDILDSVGGSLLNDLLSDLNAAVAAAAAGGGGGNCGAAGRSGDDDGGDELLFGLLERELTSTYDGGAPAPPPPPGMAGPLGMAAGKAPVPPPPPGMRQGSSAAAFVVNQHQARSNAAAAGSGNNDDAWSAALAQFGGMSLASDFLAADTASKKQGGEASSGKNNYSSSSGALPPSSGAGDGGAALGEAITSNVVSKLFEDDEDYKLEEEAVLKAGDEDGTGGLMTLLGASSSGGGGNNSLPKEGKPPEEAERPFAEAKGRAAPPKTDLSVPPVAGGIGTAASPHPPPGNFFPPPPPLMTMPPPGMAHSDMVMPPPRPMALNPPLMINPGGPPGMGPPPQPGMPPGMLHPVQPPRQGVEMLDNRNFPALGDRPRSDVGENIVQEATKKPIRPGIPAPPPEVRRRPLFNDANPAARPVPGQDVASTSMPPRDLCYVVHSMLRPLQSLDAYNDDYYHWSVANRKRLAMMRGPMMATHPPGGPPQQTQTPTPVWKEVKVITRERETKFLSSMRERAKNFSEEKKSLGQLVKTNVKRPKALLTTTVLNKENIGDDANRGGADGEGKADSKYESEQRRNRVNLWRARVRVDKGHSAFLSLVELRRLIQVHAGAPRVANDLMADVKTNVDLLHSSLGISVAGGPGGNKRIDVDGSALAGTLSLPKGRALCARVIEEGILPHPSACRLLPAALGCVLTWPAPVAVTTAGGEGKAVAPLAVSTATVEGEDRLLHALTGLVLTPRPRMDPDALCRCLELAVSPIGGEGVGSLSTITGSHVRTKLLHSILSVGKDICGAEDSPMRESWCEKEKTFMEILAAASARTN